jgi:hypothetical protein
MAINPGLSSHFSSPLQLQQPEYLISSQVLTLALAAAAATHTAPFVTPAIFPREEKINQPLIHVSELCPIACENTSTEDEATALRVENVVRRCCGGAAQSHGGFRMHGEVCRDAPRSCFRPRRCGIHRHAYLVLPMPVNMGKEHVSIYCQRHVTARFRRLHPHALIFRADKILSERLLRDRSFPGASHEARPERHAVHAQIGEEKASRRGIKSFLDGGLHVISRKPNGA